VSERPGWLDDDPPPTAPRRPLLLVLAVVPWVVVAVLLVRPLGGAPDPADVPVATEERHGPVGGPEPDAPSLDPDGTFDHTGEPTEDPVDRDAPGRGDVADDAAHAPPRTEGGADAGSSGWSITEHRATWRIAPGDGATAAVAVAWARAWLTGLDPQLADAELEPIDDATYAEHLVVEAVERPEAGAAVVTVVAVLLRTGGQAATVERLAVPVVEPAGEAPRPAGRPWWLPAPDLGATPLTLEEVDDPELSLAAAEALAGAGLDAQLVALGRTEAWPWIAVVQGQHGDAGPLQEIWLRRHLDGFAVTGLPVAPDPEVAP
jgi:hypothetical protein